MSPDAQRLHVGAKVWAPSADAWQKATVVSLDPLRVAVVGGGEIDVAPGSVHLREPNERAHVEVSASRADYEQRARQLGSAEVLRLGGRAGASLGAAATPVDRAFHREPPAARAAREGALVRLRT